MSTGNPSAPAAARLCLVEAATAAGCDVRIDGHRSAGAASVDGGPRRSAGVDGGPARRRC